MIPIKLTLQGFLSYNEPVEVDFTLFKLACISGPNGAGKSSLLDAMTWALFGQARKRDESLINTRCDVAEVSLVFDYEGVRYRVQRTNPRGRTNQLEFQIQASDGNWKVLTERALRETQLRIEETLRMDYDTFINASFFLQGKADQFTQQRPGDRKRILASILGLEVWETYKKRATEQRKELESEIDTLDGRLSEIQNELNDEDERRARLVELTAELAHLSVARVAQETSLETVRQVVARLDEQARLVDTLKRNLELAETGLLALVSRLEERRLERQAQAELLDRATEIHAAHTLWQQLHSELGRWDEIASRFREQEIQRQAPLMEIERQRARFTQESTTLEENLTRYQVAVSEHERLSVEKREAESAVLQTEVELALRVDLEVALQEAVQGRAEAQAENPRLKSEMEKLKERIEQLENAEGANCPVCGQPLSETERQALMVSLTNDGVAMGNRYRENRTLLQDSDQKVAQLQDKMQHFSLVENELRVRLRRVDQITERRKQLEELIGEWESNGAQRLETLKEALQAENFALTARALLAEVDARLKEIGYDAAQHDQVRRAEEQARHAQEEFRELEKAQAALAPLEREIANLEMQVEAQSAEILRQKKDYEQAAESLTITQAQTPDVSRMENDLLDLQEQENRLRMIVGAAQQKVDVLEDLKKRRLAYANQRDTLALRVGQYKQLERAFGKDGVPALLIEQALPQIEARANDILERLSNGTMRVSFVTQASYKDRRRDELRETLDIQISDGAGSRDYETYSGGEAFRVNFAIRLALSEVLARRAGARLQTLVIDEGFGSQDTQGRQRLIEAINLVKDDFACILVITHIDELKDYFPVRIEVQKTPSGSRVSFA